MLTDYRGNYTVPVSIQFVQQQAVVAKLRPTTQAAPTVLQPGDIITTVDGEIVADWVKARQPIFPASNQPTQLRNMAGMLLRGNTPTVRLGIIRNGKASTLDVNRVSLSSLTPPTQTAATDSSHRFLRPDVGYLTLGRSVRKACPASCPSSVKPKAW
ncbi:hypothetical protein [Hymenobacter sp. AT01-02]|uniref:hypothetical protein n=1 Tax=Hymenobacter sp. AT01-02 TaxID=1571877 RepID=UPI0006985761|nr:hypothetical protein [Hymenobacter sp. AT01-02]